MIGMETLVVDTHHRNHHQYYGRKRSNSSTKYGSFGSSPSANFRAINCRTFQSGEGLLPTPFNPFPSIAPATEQALSCSVSPRTPSPLNDYPENLTSKRIVKSRSVPVPIKIKFRNNEDDFLFSERWAGPAYSNSPSPSSLPIPKFSSHPKRTASLDLPNVISEFDLHPIAKSAPVSPTRDRSPSPIDLFDSGDDARERSPSPIDLFDSSDDAREWSPLPIDQFDSADDATRTLRCILNLDITDE